MTVFSATTGPGALTRDWASGKSGVLSVFEPRRWFRTVVWVGIMQAGLSAVSTAWFAEASRTEISDLDQSGALQLARMWTTLPSASIGMSQWLFEDSLKTSSSSGEA